MALLRSFSDKYPWERKEPPYPPIYEFNSITANYKDDFGFKQPTKVDMLFNKEIKILHLDQGITKVVGIDAWVNGTIQEVDKSQTIKMVSINGGEA